jgi:hypothetical protein
VLLLVPQHDVWSCCIHADGCCHCCCCCCCWRWWWWLAPGVSCCCPSAPLWQMQRAVLLVAAHCHMLLPLPFSTVGCWCCCRPWVHAVLLLLLLSPGRLPGPLPHLDADATADAQLLADPCYLAVGGHLDTQLACSSAAPAVTSCSPSECAGAAAAHTHRLSLQGSSSCTPACTSWACTCRLR